MYRFLAGIEVDPETPGFRKIIIQPHIQEELKWVRGSYDSIHGPIGVYWHQDDDGLHVEVDIPINTTARLFIPINGKSVVLESGRPAEKSEGVNNSETQVQHVVYTVGSGSYHFFLPENQHS